MGVFPNVGWLDIGLFFRKMCFRPATPWRDLLKRKFNIGEIK
jgi:hypothetical protein